LNYAHEQLPRTITLITRVAVEALRGIEIATPVAALCFRARTEAGDSRTSQGRALPANVL